MIKCKFTAIWSLSPAFPWQCRSYHGVVQRSGSEVDGAFTGPHHNTTQSSVEVDGHFEMNLPSLTAYSRFRKRAKIGVRVPEAAPHQTKANRRRGIPKVLSICPINDVPAVASVHRPSLAVRGPFHFSLHEARCASCFSRSVPKTPTFDRLPLYGELIR